MKLKKIFLAAAALLTAIAFTSCSQDGENGGSGEKNPENDFKTYCAKAPELPASVGENPFKDFFGKKFVYSDKESIILTENTFTHIFTGSNYKETKVYTYSWNTETKMLYGKINSYGYERTKDNTYTITATTPSQFLNEYSRLGFITPSNSDYAKYNAATTFNQNVSYQYTIGSNSISLNSKFISVVDSWNCEILDQTSIVKKDSRQGYFCINKSSNETYPLFMTSYDNSSFSGKVSSEGNDIGSFKIEYSLSDTQVKYTVKELPASLSEYLNTEFFIPVLVYSCAYSLSE